MDEMEEELALDGDQQAGAGGEEVGTFGGDLLYETPQNLLDLWKRDRPGLMRSIKQSLDSIKRTGRLRPSDLKLHIQLSPFDTSIRPLTGYEGGEFHPDRLGAACLVVSPTEGRGSNTKGTYSVHAAVGEKEETSEPGLVAVRMWPRPRKHKSAPELPGEYIKFVLEKAPVDFLVPDLDLAPQPDRAPAANSSNREPYVLMHMPKLEARVAVPELTTAMDVADTPADALPPPTLGSASEATPKHSESPDEVTGLIERLSLPGAASDSDGGAGAGEGGGGALEIAMALKTEGNQHFSAGDCPSALPLYSAAIKMLEGAGADAVLATILCNRSVTFLKLGQPASALIDAERARELGGGKAHFRLAEALSSLGRSEEALEAYEAALANAEGAKKCEVRKRIADVIPRSILMGRAQVLKTEGNQHFSSEDYSSALPRYSEAIEMLEGAGEDAALATILCNRSVTFLKLGQPASALIDAERARELGGGKAHFRLAEALSSLGRSEEALEAYATALANAEGAMKREVRERMAEVKFQQDVWERVQAAHAALDWRGVLKWDGRMEELMENHPADEDCNFILKAFGVAHNACAMSSGSKSSERASIRLEERRIHLLGRMERFRDQGEAMCNVATALIVSFADMPQEGERWYQRAREVGAAHGFFSLECEACRGLGKLLIQEGRTAEGLDLLRNALAAAPLSEHDVGDDIVAELTALQALIDALFASGAIDELEPLVPRFREATKALSESWRTGLHLLSNLMCFYFEARLHEARGRPKEAAGEVRALINCLHENQKIVQEGSTPCKSILVEACTRLKVLHPVRGEKALVKSVAVEVAKLSRG